MMLHQAREAVNKILEWLLILLFAASVVNVLYQVFTRFILQQSSPYTEELARFLLIWVGLLGSSYAAGRKMHLAMDLFLAKLSGKKAVFAELLIQVLIFLFAAAVMLTGGLLLVLLTLRLGQISSALRIKMGYVYLALPLSGLILAFFSLVLIIENLQVLTAKNKNMSYGSKTPLERS